MYALKHEALQVQAFSFHVYSCNPLPMSGCVVWGRGQGLPVCFPCGCLVILEPQAETTSSGTMGCFGEDESGKGGHGETIWTGTNDSSEMKRQTSLISRILLSLRKHSSLFSSETNGLAVHSLEFPSARNLHITHLKHIRWPAVSSGSVLCCCRLILRHCVYNVHPLVFQTLTETERRTVSLRWDRLYLPKNIEQNQTENQVKVGVNCWSCLFVFLSHCSATSLELLLSFQLDKSSSKSP